MFRVPHCSECEFVKNYKFFSTEFYCENQLLRFNRYLGVDNLPKTSPRWCPKRVDSKEYLLKELASELTVFNIKIENKDGLIKTPKQLSEEINELFFNKYFFNKNDGDYLLDILHYVNKLSE